MATGSTSRSRQLDSIVAQGKELGVFFYLFSGGEPLVRKRDLVRLCEKHDDCAFTAFTNATLIDDAFAEDLLRVKNFVPAISVEGFEEATDARRGDGTYQAVVRAMDVLRRHRLPFGVSCCYTHANAASIGSEAFVDDLVARGAKFAWFFTYMPVGASAPTDLLATAEDRAFMYRQIRAFRETKPIFTMDFWNDGEFTQGCIAGGRRYLHINANGDIEPCAFIHYADSNIRDTTILEARAAPAVHGLPRRPALQREPPASLPGARQQGPAGRDGGSLGARARPTSSSRRTPRTFAPRRTPRPTAGNPWQTPCGTRDTGRAAPTKGAGSRRRHMAAVEGFVRRHE